jgi:hypothetical protein
MNSSFPAWLTAFRQPPAEFRPVPFWSWNEKMEPIEVRRQVDEIARGGWGGAFLHSRVGLLTRYLGEEWFMACAAAMDQCRERGLKVWLYDEDKWPSGFSGGSVPLADPGFRCRVLIARPEGAPPPVSSRPLGTPVDGLQIYEFEAPLGHGWFNGACYADLMDRQAMRKFLEDAYISYHERFGRDYGTLITAEFTDEPAATFRGRAPHGGVPFSRELPERFRTMHGYDPAPHWLKLFRDEPGAARFRLHYYRTANAMFEENFSRQLGDWCREHQIALTGHYMCEHTMYDQQEWGVKIMPNYRHQGIPGIDHLCRQVQERTTAKQCHSAANQAGRARVLSEMYGCCGGGLSFADRWWIGCQQLALGINLINPHLALFSMSGCRKRDYPQNIFYQQSWWPLNHQLDDRLSRLCVALSQGAYHAEVLVVHPQESAQALWCADIPAAADSARLAEWAGQSATKATNDAVWALDRVFKALTDVLLGAQRTFDYGDETLLAQEGAVERDAAGRAVLRIGRMAYPAVVLPAMATLAPSTLRLFREFQAAGGPLFRCGAVPRWLDGEADAGLDAWLATVPEVDLAALPDHLAAAVPPAVQVLDVPAAALPLLFAHVRDLEDGSRLVFLTNLNRTHDFTARIRLSGPWRAARLLDAATGADSALAAETGADSLDVTLPFAPTQAHLLRLEREPMPARTKPHSALPAPAPHTAVLDPAAWQVERLDDNAMTLDLAYWRRGDEAWSAAPLPVIALQLALNRERYRGPLSLRYPVRMKGLLSKRRVRLVVEYPERCRVLVNGRAVTGFGKLPFWRDCRWLPADITGWLHDGENTVELVYPEFQFGDLANIQDPFARYGTEIESIYLVGDFHVAGCVLPAPAPAPQWAEWGLPPVGVCALAGDSLALTDPAPLVAGDVTTQGLPFYPGRLRLSQPLPRLGRRRPGAPGWCDVGRVDGAVAEVAVDGRRLGCLVSEPWRVDLAPALARGGRRLEITLHATLRNLLGPHHEPAGESPAVGPGNFEPVLPADQQPLAALAQWAAGRLQPGNWDPRYCLLQFGDLGGARLRW